jgi:excisionase family DNA binding protein
MAEWLGIGVATLDRLTRAGEIPSVMLGSRRCYIPAHVVAARATANAIAPPDH